MRIRFGLYLDGQRGWHAASRLGFRTLGPSGMLATLEAQLGLTRVRPGHGERVIQYRDCLAKAIDPSRFYTRSFEVDELGTSQTLLGWRDLWHLHGWDGTAAKGASKRVNDMAQIETRARNALAPCAGERLNAVLVGFGERSCGIESVEVIGALAELPLRWRQVLERLGARELPAADTPAAKGTLGLLQRELAKLLRGDAVGKIRWKDDGTLRIYRAETILLAGRWFAQLRDSLGEDALVVAESQSELLDDVLNATANPAHGFAEPSPLRPSLQLPLLAYSLLWEPLDVERLLEFLVHPVCPIPAYARHRLARALAEQPGVGGEAWTKALAEIEAHYNGKERGTAKAIAERIALWVSPTRCRREKGAPVDTLIERAQQLAAYYRPRLADEDPLQREAHETGYAQAERLLRSLEALAAQGAKVLRPTQIDEVIEQATGTGTQHPLRIARVGSLHAVTHPSAAIELFDSVLWWNMSAPAVSAPYPWTKSEIAALATAGTQLPDARDALIADSRAWFRPVFCARTRLDLVLPPAGAETHPVWQAIASLLEGIGIDSLEDVLESKNTGECPTVAVAGRPLPARRRWWALPKAVSIPPRDKHSYSSINLLVNDPSQWVLSYAAKLSASNILSLPDEARLFGNLAHRAVELLYADAGALKATQAEITTRLQSIVISLIQTEGALLMMPGRRAALEEFRERLMRATLELHRHLQAAKVKHFEPEKRLSGSFFAGALHGFADAALTNARGEQAIIDMKWSGRKRLRERLADGRHVQLAVYAELMRQADGRWPGTAYFTFRDSSLLAAAPGFFPGAQVSASQGARTTAELWAQLLVTIRWRLAQLGNGQIEVADEDIEPTDESVTPADGLETEQLYEGFNDYLHLTGWVEDV